jgi:hypothetical protein
MTKFMLPLAPLLHSFLPDVQLHEVHLLSYSTPSRMASMDGGLRSSGEVQRWCCRGLKRNGEGLQNRETEEKLGLDGGTEASYSRC